MKGILLFTALLILPFLSHSQCTVTIDQTDTIFCHGLCTGGLSANGSGGTGPYVYEWSPGGYTGNSVTGLCAGTYTVQTTDVSFCTATDIFVITEPAPISINALVSDASCSGICDGDISMTVSGGTAPYKYSWVFGDITEDLHGICPGTYCETISDTNGCELDTCFDVKEPSSILVGKNVSNVSCAGGTNGYVFLDVSGGTPPYNYFWYSTSDSTYLSDSLAAGNYCYQITDSTGCGSSDCVDVLEPLPIAVSATVTSPLCYGGNDGCIMMTLSGGTTPYTYQWNSGATTEDLCPVSATFYSIHITDTMGCTKDTSFTINQPTLLDITVTGTNSTCIACNDGTIDATPSGGTPPYTYSWSPNVSTSVSATGLPPGTYQVCVTDGNNCSSCDSIVIFEDPTFIKDTGANSFSVYPNPAKEKFTVYGLPFTQEYILKVYSVLGDQVYSTVINSKQETVNCKLPTGLYIVKLISDKGEMMGMKKVVIN